MRKLISRRVVADVLDVKLGTLAHWSVRGFGPVVIKIGSKAMYDPADVEAFIVACTRSNTSQELTPASAN